MIVNLRFTSVNKNGMCFLRHKSEEPSSAAPLVERSKNILCTYNTVNIDTAINNMTNNKCRFEVAHRSGQLKKVNTSSFSRSAIIVLTAVSCWVVFSTNLEVVLHTIY